MLDFIIHGAILAALRHHLILPEIIDGTYHVELVALEGPEGWKVESAKGWFLGESEVIIGFFLGFALIVLDKLLYLFASDGRIVLTLAIPVPQVYGLEVWVENIHLAVVVVQHRPVQLAFSRLTIFERLKFDKQLRDFAALEDEDFADAAVRAELWVDEVISQLEHDRVVDTDKQDTWRLLRLDSLWTVGALGFYHRYYRTD
jgi:hypothetical protein